MNWQELMQHAITAKIVATALLVPSVLGLHLLLRRTIQARQRLSKHIRRRWIVNSRNAAFLLILVGAVIIWFEQLRTLAAGVVVIAVAFVLATKEIWLNVSGFLFRTGTHFFSIGDRIEVGDLRGDVIDQRFTGTTILEIGPGTKSHQYTGRAIFIPNSRFLSAPVVNEAYMRNYVFHIISVPIKRDADWQKAEEALLRAANEVCEPYLDKARDYMRALEKEHNLDAPAIDPRVQIQLPDPKQINLVLRVPIPARRRGRMEQDIVRRFLLYYQPAEEAEKKDGEE